MKKNKFLIILFVLAVISGVFWNQKIFNKPISSDQEIYDGVAMNVLDNGNFVYQGKDTPVEPAYPVFLAGVYKFFGHNYNAVRIIQILLFALTAIMVYLLAEMVFDKKIATVSGLLFSVFYGIANQAGDLLTETLFIFLLILFLLLLYKAFDNGISKKWLLLSGVALGLATLTRGIVEYLAILVAVSIFILSYRSLHNQKKAFSNCLIFVLAFILTLIPWILRNQMVTNKTELTARGGDLLFARVELMNKLSINYGEHLIGHLFGYYFAQKINPNINATAFRDTPETDRKIADLEKLNGNSAEINKILMDQSKKAILANPGNYILMSGLDIISLNSPVILEGPLWQDSVAIHPMFADNRYANLPAFVKISILLIIRFAWFLFLFLVVYSLIKNLKNWDRIGTVLIVILYFNLSYSAVHAIPRYALPIYPLYMILAVSAIFSIYPKLFSKYVSRIM